MSEPLRSGDMFRPLSINCECGLPMILGYAKSSRELLAVCVKCGKCGPIGTLVIRLQQLGRLPLDIQKVIF